MEPIYHTTDTEYRRMAEDNCGLCLACLEIAEGGIEPDARGYTCEACGAHEVYGIEEALIMGAIGIGDPEGEGEEEAGGIRLNTSFVPRNKANKPMPPVFAGVATIHYVYRGKRHLIQLALHRAIGEDCRWSISDPATGALIVSAWSHREAIDRAAIMLGKVGPKRFAAMQKKLLASQQPA